MYNSKFLKDKNNFLLFMTFLKNVYMCKNKWTKYWREGVYYKSKKKKICLVFEW